MLMLGTSSFLIGAHLISVGTIPSDFIPIFSPKIFLPNSYFEAIAATKKIKKRSKKNHSSG